MSVFSIFLMESNSCEIEHVIFSIFLSGRFSWEAKRSCGWSIRQDSYDTVSGSAFRVERDPVFDPVMDFYVLDFCPVGEKEGKDLNVNCCCLTNALEDRRGLHGCHVGNFPSYIFQHFHGEKEIKLFFLANEQVCELQNNILEHGGIFSQLGVKSLENFSSSTGAPISPRREWTKQGMKALNDFNWDHTKLSSSVNPDQQNDSPTLLNAPNPKPIHDHLVHNDSLFFLHNIWVGAL